MSPDNTNLIYGLRNGDYDSYESLFRLYFVRFVNFAHTIIKDRAVAKDLVQEAFVKVWVNRERLDENLSIESYLYVIVKRAVLNFLRNRKFTETIDNECVAVSETESVAETLVDYNDTRRRIADKVAEMPPQRRTVFMMSRNMGKSNKEIAEELNLSVKTVERHITMALSDLRRLLS